MNPWQATNKAPTDVWVLCFWPSGKYSIGQYTHRYGWRDESLEVGIKPPVSWVPLPDEARPAVGKDGGTT